MNSRPYQGSADLRLMTDLTQVLRASGQVVYPIAADLYEELAELEVQATVRLWETDLGQLAGFAYVNHYQNLVYVFTASELTPDIEGELIRSMVSAVQHRNQNTGVIQSLDANALESDLPRQAFLERHGFQRQAESSILMARPLDQPIPIPRLPLGFSIRTVTGEAEISAYVALHQAAFGTQNMTVELRRTIMSSPDYIPDLDLVAVAPNGDLAAFCVCQIFPDDTPRAGGRREGWTDPLGTHPNYQQLGLAKALILTGLNLLKARGIDTALLGTSSTNTVMQHTAQATGFRFSANTLWYSKSVS